MTNIPHRRVCATTKNFSSQNFDNIVNKLNKLPQLIARQPNEIHQQNLLQKGNGPIRESNPGPPAPKAGIMPLDQSDVVAMEL